MGWLDQTSRAAWEALNRSPGARRAADVGQAAFEGAMQGLGNLGHVVTAPARAIAAAAYNTQAGPGRAPVSVMDTAIYGRDMSTGVRAPTYGDLLAGTLEDAGEIAPNGIASKLVRLAGDAVTDPAMAPALMSGAEAIGALGGAMTPTAAPMQPRMPYRPRSSPPGRPAPPGPAAGPSAPPRPQSPYPPLGPTDTRPTATVRGPLSGQTQPLRIPEPEFNPTATQKVPMMQQGPPRVRKVKQGMKDLRDEWGYGPKKRPNYND